MPNKNLLNIVIILGKNKLKTEFQSYGTIPLASIMIVTVAIFS